MSTKSINVCWNELATTDVEKSQLFYIDLFNWESNTTKIGDTNYVTFTSNDQEVAGLMQSSNKTSQWIPYMAVKDVDKAAKNSEILGGKVLLQPRDMPNVGRIAVISDPTGAVFGVFKKD